MATDDEGARPDPLHADRPPRPASGGCLCGAVRFTISALPLRYGTCHCEMCRRWTGSALLGITVAHEAIAFTGEAAIRRLQSSSWAERAWCGECGSGLWYRVTSPGAMSAALELPLGLLDDPDGLVMSREIFIDCKPDSFAFAGHRPRLTRAEVLAMYAPSPPVAD